MMGATQAWQQLTFIQGELRRVFRVQHLPAPATPVHIQEGGEGGNENEEEQRRRAASRQMGQPAPWSRNEGALYSILPRFQGRQVKATETSLIHQEKEGEADMFVGKEVWIRADPVPAHPSPFKQQQEQQPHGGGLP